MQVQFDHFEAGKLIMSCPLAPNINDKGTGFAGSIASLANICGWTFTMLHARTVIAEPEAMIVEQTMQYKAPVTGDFTATCEAEVSEDFYQRLKDGRSGKMNLTIKIESEGTVAAINQAFYLARARQQ